MVYKLIALVFGNVFQMRVYSHITTKPPFLSVVSLNDIYVNSSPIFKQ